MGSTRQQGLRGAETSEQPRGRITGRRIRRGETPIEERPVEAADPALSPETNALVTDELREVVGSETAQVPVDRPHASRGEVGHRQGALGYLNEHRFEMLRAAAITVTFGAIVALTTGTWWVLPLAAGVHALGTMLVVLTVVRMTTIVEHPSPDVAAALAEDGVSSPDGRFSQMVEEFSPVAERGADEVLSPGHNERTVPAGENPAAAAAEQSSSMTPTEDPSPSGGEGGTPDYLIWVTAGALFILSIVLPATMGGGWMWLLTAVMVPLVVGWVAIQRLMLVGSDKVRLRGNAPLVAIVIGTAVAVAAFCAVVALAFAH